MRSLVISTNLPYPAFGGVDMRNWQNVNGLMHFGQVAVFGLCSNDPRRNEIPHSHRAFWCCSTDPALAYPSPRQKLKSRAWLVEPMGHPSDMYYSDIAASEIENLLTRFEVELVVLEGLWVCRYIEVLRHHSCRIVLDSHNVETAAFQEIANSITDNDLFSKIIRNVLPERTRIIEQEASEAVDQVWVCSRDDARLMKEKHGSSTPIHIVPNAVNVEHYRDVRAGKLGRPTRVLPTKHTIVFPASFGWEPNAKAAAFLIEEIIPRLVKIHPDCQLLLVGSTPSVQMLEAAKGDPRIFVTGLVPDVRPYLGAASIMIVPLFQGSGTRLKILEAFASNLPVISTTKGAEGLNVEDGTHLLLAEDADEFVNAIKRIWTDKHLAKRLVTSGLELVREQYSWDVTKPRIAKALHELEGR